jgi:hypothetical protein
MTEVKKELKPGDEGFEEKFADAELNMTKSDLNPTEKPRMRQIIIETDGNQINLVKSETAGKLELTAILQNLIVFINQVK